MKAWIDGGADDDDLLGEEGVDTLNGGSGNSDFCDGGGQIGDSDTNCEWFWILKTVRCEA